MSDTSAAPMTLRTRIMPLVLLLFITSTIPLSPAVDATSSRNLQDFQIVAPVEPFINGSYDLWEAQSLIVDVRNNASTPIGGRQLKLASVQAITRLQTHVQPKYQDSQKHFSCLHYNLTKSIPPNSAVVSTLEIYKIRHTRLFTNLVQQIFGLKTIESPTYFTG